MNVNEWKGSRVHLTPVDPENDAALLARWSRNSEFDRLRDSEPARPFTAKAQQESMKKWIDQAHWFCIRAIANDQPVGLLEVDGIDPVVRNAWVGIALGEEFWGQGFGTDAMRVAVSYAFHQLNLERLSLTVFDYNPRAIRSYEKVGFRLEGRQRQAVLRAGRSWDMLFMALFRADWETAGVED